MPKYILDLEKSLDFQNELSSCISDNCDVTEECYECKYEKICSFNINLSVLLRREINKSNERK